MTNPQLTALAPCPFCGGVNTRVVGRYERGLRWVACQAEGCEVEGPPAQAADEAIRFWNQRAAASAPPAATGGVRELLDEAAKLLRDSYRQCVGRTGDFMVSEILGNKWLSKYAGLPAATLATGDLQADGQVEQEGRIETPPVTSVERGLLEAAVASQWAARSAASAEKTEGTASAPSSGWESFRESARRLDAWVESSRADFTRLWAEKERAWLLECASREEIERLKAELETNRANWSDSYTKVVAEMQERGEKLTAANAEVERLRARTEELREMLFSAKAPDYDPEDGHVCAKCHGMVTVDVGGEFDPGDFCDRCCAEVVPLARALLNDVANPERAADEAGTGEPVKPASPVRTLAPGWNRLDDEVCCYWCPAGHDTHSSGFARADSRKILIGACQDHAEAHGAFAAGAGDQVKP